MLVLPRRISPDPIVDSTVEIRFDPLIDRNAVFGVIYYALREQFPTVEPLPVTQIPEPLREADPFFAFRPQYRIYNERYQVLVGYNVLTISVLGTYPGWSEFFSTIQSVYAKVVPLGVVGPVKRLGVRYISFFEGNILDRLKLHLTIPGHEQIQSPVTIRIELPSGQFVNALSLANHTTLQQTGTNISRVGSIIDIDTSVVTETLNFSEQANELINGAHQSEKELFYSLLTDDFLAELNPEY